MPPPLYSGLLKRIKKGEFVTSVQIDPPRTKDAIASLKPTMQELKKAGVRIIDINSSRITKKRVPQDSIHLASKLKRLGFETIPHVTTRDSSIDGLLSRIRAAYELEGIRNFLIITGDPNELSQAIYPTEGIFQADAVEAIRVFDIYLRNGLPTEKFPREEQPLGLQIFLGAAINQNEPDFQKEESRLRKKQENGADFFMSQTVFNEAQIHKLLELYHRAEIAKPLLVGIWPLLNAQTIDNIYRGVITGVVLPGEVYEEVGAYRENIKELRARETERALRLIALLKKNKLAQGVYIVAPTRNPLLLLNFITQIAKP